MHIASAMFNGVLNYNVKILKKQNNPKFSAFLSNASEQDKISFKSRKLKPTTYENVLKRHCLYIQKFLRSLCAISQSAQIAIENISLPEFAKSQLIFLSENPKKINRLQIEGFLPIRCEHGVSGSFIAMELEKQLQQFRAIYFKFNGMKFFEDFCLESKEDGFFLTIQKIEDSFSKECTEFLIMRNSENGDILNKWETKEIKPKTLKTILKGKKSVLHNFKLQALKGFLMSYFDVSEKEALQYLKDRKPLKHQKFNMTNRQEIERIFSIKNKFNKTFAQSVDLLPEIVNNENGIKSVGASKLGSCQEVNLGYEALLRVFSFLTDRPEECFK